MITFQNPEIFIFTIFIVFLAPKIFKFIGVKKEIGFLNLLAAFLLIFAAAGPQMTVEEASNPKPEVKVIQDVSESSQLIKDRDLESEEANLVQKTVNSDRSDFVNQVETVTETNDTVLFNSDFNTDIEGLQNYLRENNISSNIYRSDTVEEHAVRIEGPTRTVIGAENQFEAVSSSTVDETQITVGLGNETIYSGEAPYEFDMSFDEEGQKQLWVETEYDDEYSENNEYYKVVDVREKPEIAVIGESGGLEEDLTDFYEVEKFTSVPSDLQDYDSVILKESVDSTDLENYIIEGGGLVYTGSEYGQSYLPVRESDEEFDTEAPLVVIAIQISHAIGCMNAESCIDAEERGLLSSIKLSHDIVSELPSDARVSVLPYSEYPYSEGNLGKPIQLGNNREDILEDISSLTPVNSPPRHHLALREANSIIDTSGAGEGNIVMINNGHIPTNPVYGSRSDVLTEADSTNNRLINVGLGNEEFEPDKEDRQFLTEVAERNQGGYYLDGHSVNQLEFDFDAGGGSDENQPLTVTDSNHFIMENGLMASVSSMDSTEAKSSASQLVSAADSRPFLTTWRYGLGKVAAFSGDNQDLEELMSEEPGLVGRTMSWSTKRDDQDLWVEGSRKGDNFKLVSDEDREGFTRKSQDRFEKSLDPNSTGFYSEEGLTYSKNYREEIKEVGYNEDNLREASVNGRIYSSGDLESFFESVEADTGQRLETRDLTMYVLTGFLLVYMVFVALRKRNGLA